MQKTEALKLFLEHEVRELSKSFLLNSMEELKKEVRQEKIDAFVRDYQMLLKACQEKKENNGDSVRYLQLSLVRSKALNQQPFYILEAYGSMFYLSQPIASQEVSLKWLYEKYGLFCSEIERQSRKYILKIDGMELDRIKLIELVTCNRIVKHLLESSLVYIINLDEFRELELAKGIQMQMGEYRGPFETFFVTDEYTANIGRWWNGIL